MRIIVVLLSLCLCLFSMELLGEEDGITYYCLDNKVEALTNYNGSNEKILIPVVHVEDDEVSMVACLDYAKWVKINKEK